MGLRDRIGFDAGGTRLEDALESAAAHGIHYLDFNADVGPNRLDVWDDERVRAIRDDLPPIVVPQVMRHW